MNLPSREDINVDDTLDERTACEHFLGKNLEQAEAMFREASIVYQEDLMFMGPVTFRFYVPAAIRYVQSDSASGDSDIVNSLAGIFERFINATWLTLSRMDVAYFLFLTIILGHHAAFRRQTICRNQKPIHHPHARLSVTHTCLANWPGLLVC